MRSSRCRRAALEPGLSIADSLSYPLFCSRLLLSLAGFSRITPTRFAFDASLSGGASLAQWQRWLAEVYPGKAKKTGRVAFVSREA